ncbi:hypothetical protein [Candidatus Viridilinea mediisalina]|uniref:NADH:quinone oxidoreductase/Mrp antiporter membrane subunit domain-containing protein n=1 Tax=Candidatus Viridilinea mediisalina TaxID=2024553 RepID=A0A2A6RMQ4_9CHLR|nr:hypothetical protein [Candidatus Viridilinea mediisalina]PDW04223.1 hypothetical protein CJ255_04540 [Candidatus Viridilinea mediisalina]
MMRTLFLFALLASGFVLLLVVADRPFDPGRLQGWVRADALSALLLCVLAGYGLSEVRQQQHDAHAEDLMARETEGRQRWPRLSQLGDQVGGVATRAEVHLLLPVILLSLAMLTGHLMLLSGLLVGAALLRGRHAYVQGTQQNSAALGSLAVLLVASLAAAGGLILLGLQSGAWHYAAPMAGSGLNSLSFGLLLLAATIGSGGLDLVRGRVPQFDPLINVACLYCLLRLFSLGPWNIGWLFATMLVGGAIVLAAAWQGAVAPSNETAAWQGGYLSGLIITGAGLGSDAGIILATYSLLLMPIVHFSLSQPQAPHWSYWLLCAALPLSAPFISAWLAVAAALAGGMTLLAVSLWAAALLAALPVARLARQGAQPTSLLHYQTIGLGVGVALGAPLIIPNLLAPIAAQLQSGLTPFGSIELWPWAGLMALNAARQPVATLPSLALLALMLILAALCWLGFWYNPNRTTGQSEGADDQQG